MLFLHSRREKKNLQDLSSLFLFSVDGRDGLDRPTTKLIKEFDKIEESFMKEIGSQYGVVSGSRENSLYNALWVAQALLRRGDKRILLFTDEDDPFGNIKGVTKLDRTRTTLQQAKDMLGLEGDALAEFVPSAVERLQDMRDQLRKHMFQKRWKYRTFTFSIANVYLYN